MSSTFKIQRSHCTLASDDLGSPATLNIELNFSLKSFIADQSAIAIRVESVADLRGGWRTLPDPCFGIIEAIMGFHDPSP